MTANLTSKVDAKSLMVGEGKSSEQKTKDKKDAK